MMIPKFVVAMLLVLAFPAVASAASPPTDPQIAHIAYTAGEIDITAAKQALDKSKNPDVIAFAKQMVEDHTAVNSQALSKAASDKLAELAKLDGPAFDKAYVDNEVAYHKAVNSALSTTLIPSAQNAELKALLEQGLTLFTEHQKHAEMVAAGLK